MLPLRDDYTLEIESRLPRRSVAGLARLGIRVKPLPTYDYHMGSFQMSWRDAQTGLLCAAPMPGGRDRRAASNVSRAKIGAIPRQEGSMKTYEMLIGGEWTKASPRKTFDVFDPASGEVIAKVPEASPADVDRAVRAARAAFDGGWRDATAQERGRDAACASPRRCATSCRGWPSSRPATPASPSWSRSTT